MTMLLIFALLLSVIVLTRVITSTPADRSMHHAYIAKVSRISPGQRVLFVFAHPDDEGMFMTPTLSYFSNQGRAQDSSEVAIYWLCLTNGNAAGLGKQREKELLRSASIFGVPHENVFIIRDDYLVDSMTCPLWDTERVMHYVNEAVHQSLATDIFTFDAQGISQHINHKSAYWGVHRWLNERSTRCKNESLCQSATPRVWCLRTFPLCSKYVGPLALLAPTGRSFTPQVQTSGTPEDEWIVQTRNVLSSIQNVQLIMNAHHSQLVWFRRLFILFSRYTYHNEWHLLDTRHFNEKNK